MSLVDVEPLEDIDNPILVKDNYSNAVVRVTATLAVGPSRERKQRTNSMTNPQGSCTCDNVMRAKRENHNPASQENYEQHLSTNARNHSKT
jgi:hypothetical protein